MGSLQTGEIVGRYRVEERIGEGGLATVYRVKHVELGSQHALKVLLHRHPALTRRMRTEGQIQASIDHPAIVRVTDMLEVDGYGALIMEYIDGETLAGLIARVGPMTTDDALTLMSPIFSAISAAHGAGVVHRDLKPANILMSVTTGGLRPMVTDFGIARLLETEGHTRVGAAMGSPGYLAPEQLTDASDADERADVWALGVLLYELLAGKPAFPGHDVNTPPVPITTLRPDCPGWLAEAIATSMQPERDQRFVNAREMADHILSRHPGLRDTVALPPTLAPSNEIAAGVTLAPTWSEPETEAPLPPTAPPKRHPVLALGVGLLLPLVALASVWWLWSRGEAENAGVVVDAPADPIAEPPAAPEPAVIAPAIEEAGEPAAEAPEVDAPVEEDVASEEPIVEEPEVDEPAAEAPVAEEPAPVADEPAEEPPTEEPVVEAAAEEPTAEEPAAEEPQVAEEPPAEAPAAEATEAIADATPVVEEPPEAAPDLSGRWAGELDGHRLLLTIEGSDRIRATATVTMGATQRYLSFTGSLTDTTLRLTDDSTGLTLTGTVSGDTLRGTATRRSGRRASAWHASRMQ